MPTLTGLEAVCALWNWENDWRSDPANRNTSYGFERNRPLLKLTTLRNTKGKPTRHIRTKAQFSGGNFAGSRTSLSFTYRAVFYHAYWNPHHCEPEETSPYGLPKDLLVSVEFNDSVPFETSPPESGNRLSTLREWQSLPSINLLEVAQSIAEVHERDDDPRIRVKTKRSGETFGIQIVDYPGKPFGPGSIGEILAKKDGKPPMHDGWSFWTSGEIDYATIFKGEDVEEVIIPNTQKWRGVFKGSPFKVTIDRKF